MRNFLIGLIVGFLLVGLTLLVIVFAAVRFAGSYANRPASVADGSTLVLDLEGDVPERLPAQIPIPILQSQTALSVEQLWDMFRRAATDSRVRAILFEPRGVDIGWLVTVRLLFGGITLLGLSAAVRGRSVLAVWRHDSVPLILFGLIGMMPVQYTYMAAIQASNSAAATVLQFLASLFNLLGVSQFFGDCAWGFLLLLSLAFGGGERGA